MGKLTDCERIVQEAIDGLGGLDVIISNAVGFAIYFPRPCKGEDYECCNVMASSDVQRAGQNFRLSGILTLSVKLIGTRY